MTATQKISLLIQRLITGRAQDWAAAVWREGSNTVMVYRAFLVEFKVVFDHPDQGQSSGQWLIRLKQGQDFRILMTNSV